MGTAPSGQFAGQNWLIIPAPLAVNESPPRSISDQKWLLVLSGVCIPNLEGTLLNDWRRETLTIVPDIDSPLEFAITRYSIPKPQNPNNPPVPKFNLEPVGWVPFAAVSSTFDNNTTDAGFAVDVWRPTPFVHTTDVVSGQPVTNVFAGIDVDVAVRNSKAFLYRVSYYVTLVGKIVFVPPMQ
jgi:hypothetical protein